MVGEGKRHVLYLLEIDWSTTLYYIAPTHFRRIFLYPVAIMQGQVMLVHPYFHISGKKLTLLIYSQLKKIKQKFFGDDDLEVSF